MTASNRRLLMSAVVGGALSVSLALVTALEVAVLVGWCAAAVSFLVHVGSSVRRFDAADTRQHARGEEPSLLFADAAMLVAALASLGGVVVILIKADESTGASKGFSAALGAVSVAVAWAVVQTMFTLRYARIYYDEPAGGVDFGDDEPDYGDFAYLAFTIGMTYQVSDTTITSRALRRVVLRHALLSFLFATSFIAVLINVVGGLFG